MKRSDVNHFILGILMVTSLTSTVIPGVDGAGTELLDVYNFKPQNSEKIADDIHNESQVTITGGLSLEDAVRLALRFNRSLQSMIEEKAIARGQIVEAYGYVTPVIQLDGSYTRLDEVSSFQLEDGVVNLGYLDNYSATFQVVQPVFHGGALSAGIRAAKLYRTLTDRSIGTMVQEIVFQTVKAYYDVVLAEKQLDVETMHVELAEKHLQDVLTKQKYGVASTFNVLRAEVELSNARALLLSYQNSLHQARHNLFKTVGVSQRSEVALTDTLAHRPLVISEQAALTKAMGNRPDLNSAALTVELQKEAWTASKSAYWPQVDAFYRYTLAKPDPKISTINDWGETWQAGLTIHFDLFFIGREGRVYQEAAKYRQQKLQYLDMREQVIFEVRSAISALEDADEFVKAQARTVDQANEGLRLAEVGYKEGTLDQVSVLEARTALNQAQLLYWNSLYNHTIARISLEKALGELDPKLQENTTDENQLSNLE